MTHCEGSHRGSVDSKCIYSAVVVTFTYGICPGLLNKSHFKRWEDHRVIEDLPINPLSFINLEESDYHNPTNPSNRF